MDHARKLEERMVGIARRAAVAGLLVLALSAGDAEVAAAQAWGHWGAGAGYVSAGISGTATGELDDQLAARGYPTFGRTTQALGIGAYWILSGGVMLGGEWNGLSMGEEAHEGRTVGLSGGYATLSIGYALKLSPRVRVYPRLGLGGGGFGLWIGDEGGEVGFDEVLADPDAYVADDPDDLTVLDRDGMVVDLGGGAELLPGGRGRGLLVGLRLGYLAAPSHSDWGLVDRRTVSGGPAATIAGPYVRLVVGGTIGGR